MAVDTSNEIMSYLKRFADWLESMTKKMKENAQFAEQQRLLDRQYQQELELYKYITVDGTLAPKMLTINNDPDLVKYITQKAEEEGYKFKLHEDARTGQCIILCNEDTANYFNQQKILFAIQDPSKSGYIREVSVENFEKTLTSNNEMVVIKNLTEQQYLNLTRKSYDTKNAFSFVATEQINNKGEKSYTIAVDNKNYLNAATLSGKDDMFTALAINDIFPNKALEASNKYEADLEMKIFNYDKDEPMYIAQLTNGDSYLKVERDKITVFNANDESKTFYKVPGKERDFAVDVMRIYDNYKNPIEITDDIINKKITPSGMSLENYLANHIHTGLDQDFGTYNINTKSFDFPRPLGTENLSEEALNLKNMLGKELKNIERLAKTEQCKDYITKCATWAKAQGIASGMSPEIANTFSIKYKVALHNALMEHNPAVNNKGWADIQQKAISAAQKAIDPNGNYINSSDIAMSYPIEYNEYLKGKPLDLEKAANNVLVPYREIQSRYKEFSASLSDTVTKRMADPETQKVISNIVNEKISKNPNFAAQLEKETISDLEKMHYSKDNEEYKKVYNDLYESKAKNMYMKLHSDATKEVENKILKEERTAWYEETKGILALDDKGELVNAYIKELAFTSDSGPLSDIPDKIDGTVKSFSMLEKDEFEIDNEGNLLNEGRSGQTLRSVMNYDEHNYNIDKNVQDLNLARAENYYKESTFKTDNIEITKIFEMER